MPRDNLISVENQGKTTQRAINGIQVQNYYHSHTQSIHRYICQLIQGTDESMKKYSNCTSEHIY